MAANNSPNEAESSTRPRPPASKDRECPYCHEFFTSSSLGRHLDQFIREDKPKPPDGKHNVEEIQRLRGGVTRRNARNSSSRRDLRRRESASNEPTPPAKKPRLNGPDSNFVALNRPNWLTTGVIADVNTEALAALPSVMTSQYNFEDQQRQFVAERNEGRAAKLALTELVDSIKASLARPAHSSPFSFDFLSQSFPSLVLRLLPSQPTINSPQIIPNPKCWPIDPPGEKHLNQLHEMVTRKLDTYRHEVQSRRKRHSSEDSHSEGSPSPEPESTEQDSMVYAAHLEAAYELYSAMSTAEKTKLWHLSALRAFTEEQEAHKETYKRLEKAEQHLAHQIAQVKRLSSIQQPREYLMNPPTATPLPSASAEAVVAEMIGKQSSSESTPLLNVGALIAKWKPSVQDNRGFQKSFMSVMEAAARTVASGNDAHNADEVHGVDGGVDGIGDGIGDGTVDGNGDGPSQLPGGPWTSNGAYSEPGEPGPRDDIGHSDADHGGVGDGVGDGANDSSDETGPSTSAAPMRSSRALAQDALDPSLRSSGTGRPRDQGEFGAEDLLAKLSSMGNASGIVRKRGKR